MQVPVLSCSGLAGCVCYQLWVDEFQGFGGKWPAEHADATSGSIGEGQALTPVDVQMGRRLGAGGLPGN